MYRRQTGGKTDNTEVEHSGPKLQRQTCADSVRLTRGERAKLEATSHCHCSAVRRTAFVDSSCRWDCERESNGEPTWILARSRWASPPCYHSDSHWRSSAVRLLHSRSPSWPPTPCWKITKRTTFGIVFTEEHVTGLVAVVEPPFLSHGLCPLFSEINRCQAELNVSLVYLVLNCCYLWVFFKLTSKGEHMTLLRLVNLRKNRIK